MLTGRIEAGGRSHVEERTPTAQKTSDQVHAASQEDAESEDRGESVQEADRQAKVMRQTAGIGLATFSLRRSPGSDSQPESFPSIRSISSAW